MVKKIKWKKIGPIPGRPFAEMIGEILQEREVPYEILMDGIATAYGFSGVNLVGNEVFLLVPPEYEQEVQELVDRILNPNQSEQES